MEEVIRDLLSPNHPENSDFSGDKNSKSKDSDVCLFSFLLWYYLFIHLLAIHPFLTIGMNKNKRTSHSTKRTSLNNLISF